MKKICILPAQWLADNSFSETRRKIQSPSSTRLLGAKWSKRHGLWRWPVMHLNSCICLADSSPTATWPFSPVSRGPPLCPLCLRAFCVPVFTTVTRFIEKWLLELVTELKSWLYQVTRWGAPLTSGDGDRRTFAVASVDPPRPQGFLFDVGFFFFFFNFWQKH